MPPDQGFLHPLPRVEEADAHMLQVKRCASTEGATKSACRRAKERLTVIRMPPAPASGRIWQPPTPPTMMTSCHQIQRLPAHLTTQHLPNLVGVKTQQPPLDSVRSARHCHQVSSSSHGLPNRAPSHCRTHSPIGSAHLTTVSTPHVGSSLQCHTTKDPRFR
jgi:hypothetical protein